MHISGYAYNEAGNRGNFLMSNFWKGPGASFGNGLYKMIFRLKSGRKRAKKGLKTVIFLIKKAKKVLSRKSVYARYIREVAESALV